MSRPVHLKDGLNYTGSGGGSSNHLTDKMVANYEDSSISTHHYDIGEQFIYTTKLYEATSAISIGDTIVTDGANANCMESDSLTEQIAKKGSADNFIGTRQQWEALTPEEQSKYRTMDLIGDHGVITLTATLSFTTNNSAFYGQTITVKDGNNTTLTTATFSNQGTATATLIGSAGYYTASVVAYGVTKTEQIALTESGEYNVVLNSVLILGAWIDKGGLDYTDYADFSEVEADEEAVRRLMTIHASVDYLAECGSATDSLASSIINSDICAKWINLRDYALDTLYANAYLKAMMDTADKYFYGEWVITDNTTTPPTWGAKGNVPVMTANDAPYGTASASDEKDNTTPAWKAFDGDITTTWQVNMKSMPWIQYKFTNPVIVKRVSIYETQGGEGSSVGVKYYNLWLSNDGTTWTKFNNIFGAITTGVNRWYTTNINNNNAYLYARLEIDGTIAAYWGTREIQFYGRELRESVPTMTSNTAPYGVASVESDIGTDYTAWKAFNNDSSTYWLANSETWIQYEFNNDVVVKMFSFMGYDYNNTCNEYKIFGIDDSNVLHEVAHDNLSNVATLQTVSINNSIPYKKWRFLVISDYSADGNIHNSCARILNFYGLNYSEYDWDTEHPRHYLYDHGVEPNETVQTQKGSNGEITKRANGEYYLKQVGTAVADRVGIGINTDLTSYSLGRCSIGSTNLLASNDNVGLWVFSTNLVTGTVSYVTIYPTICNLPYAIGLDLSSVNSTYYFSASVNVNNYYLTITELWLE